MKLQDVIELNPRLTLRKGSPAPFIEMAALPTNEKFIAEVGQREVTGSGAKFQNGDTLFARITPCLENGKGGYVAGLPPEAVGQGSTEFIVFRARKKGDEQFAYYLSRYPKFRSFAEQGMEGTSGRQRVTWQTLADFELPELEERERSALGEVLASLDDKIELNRRMNETLEEMARALFRDWFVDFGPTRRQMEGATDPAAIMGHAFPPEKATTLALLFPAKLGEDGLPDGWAMSSVGDHMAIFDAKRVPLSSREREKRVGPYPYHGATSVMGFVDDYLFDDVILLLGEDGSVIKPNGKPFTQYVWGKVWVNNHAHVLRGKSFSTEQLKVIFDHVDIAPFTTGAVQLKLNQKNLKSVPLVLANADVHTAYDDVILPMFAKVRANVEENQTLAALRDLLLPKLMSGEIRLKDAEANTT